MKKRRARWRWRWPSASVASHALAVGPRSSSTRRLPPYKAASGVSGNSRASAPTTLNNLMTLWAEGFSKYYPNVKIQIEGKGSSTAPPALIAGTAQLGPMCRAMKGTEIDEFEKKFGYKPTADPHRGRRARRLRQQGQPDQVPDARAGRRDLLEDAPAGRQGRHHDLGPARPHRRVGQQADQPLRPQLGLRAPTASSRSTRSRTATTRTRSRSSRARPRWCRASPWTASRIGYSGIGYATSGVRAVPLAEKEGGKCVEADRRQRLRRERTRSRASSTSTSTRRRASRSTRWPASS